MNPTQEIKQLLQELKQNHITRIRDTAPGYDYYKLVEREVEIKARLDQLGYQEDPELVKHGPWSQKDITFLRDFYQEMTNEQLATQLKRNIKQVEYRASLLGLKKEKLETVKTEKV